MSICETYKRLAINTWNEIKKSHQVNFQLKEETFTDINMLALKTEHFGQIRTKVFTKREEGRHGADWEWWFKGQTNKWIGFRVQAKIINIQSNEFEHLHYRNPRSRIYQCDKLIRNALTAPYPKIPLYCFYVHSDNSQYLNTWHCGTYPQSKDLFGCSLTSAFTVKNLQATNSKHLTDLQNKIEPWHCLVCCKGYGGRADFITNIQGFVLARFEFNREYSKELNITIPENFITETPPDYILALMENENISDFTQPDEDLDGIMICIENQQ